jgi:RimJ/RimL family protein N-acetyltransferase
MQDHRTHVRIRSGGTLEYDRRVGDVRLEPWTDADLPLLRRIVGDPAMMEHLGGPESETKIADRLRRYVQPDSGMFKIVAGGEGVGSVGFWEREWRGERVLETGWSVVPEHQGRGIAATATAQAIERARAAGTHRHLHAFPSVDNAASNALCRRLGFTLLGPYDFEYPPGHPLRCNDWRLELRPA